MDLEQSRSRRHQREREQRRRRRRAALGALLVVLVAAAVVAVLSRSGGSSTTGGAAHPTAATAAVRGAHAPRSDPSGLPPATPASDAPGGPPGHDPVPILMYHVINPPPGGAPFPGLYVAPSEFAAQMHALAAAGWHGVTLDQLWAYWHRGVPLGPGKPIVISFDNGYESQYTHALPVLRALRWQGDLNIQLTGLPPSQGGISHAQVRRLLDAGWELDTQGISHADLITLDAAELHEQVATARQLLQTQYHVPVNWFCYPSGHYDSTVIAAVKAAGFVGSTTVIPGWSSSGEDPYRLSRIRVLGGTSPGALLALIDGVRTNPAPPGAYSGA